jgi:hypothetical protein
MYLLVTERQGTILYIQKAGRSLKAAKELMEKETKSEATISNTDHFSITGNTGYIFTRENGELEILKKVSIHTTL